MCMYIKCTNPVYLHIWIHLCNHHLVPTLDALPPFPLTPLQQGSYSFYLYCYILPLEVIKLNRYKSMFTLWN